MLSTLSIAIQKKFRKEVTNTKLQHSHIFISYIFIKVVIANITKANLVQSDSVFMSSSLVK